MPWDYLKGMVYHSGTTSDIYIFHVTEAMVSKTPNGKVPFINDHAHIGTTKHPNGVNVVIGLNAPEEADGKVKVTGTMYLDFKQNDFPGAWHALSRVFRTFGGVEGMVVSNTVVKVELPTSLADRQPIGGNQDANTDVVKISAAAGNPEPTPPGPNIFGRLTILTATTLGQLNTSNPSTNAAHGYHESVFIGRGTWEGTGVAPVVNVYAARGTFICLVPTTKNLNPKPEDPSGGPNEEE